MQKREGKWYVRIEIDEEVKNRMVGNSRRNPIAAAHWVHVKCKYCDSLNVFRYGYDRKGIRIVINDYPEDRFRTPRFAKASENNACEHGSKGLLIFEPSGLILLGTR